MATTFDEAAKCIKQDTSVSYTVTKGMVPNMRVPAKFYVDDNLKEILYEELESHFKAKGFGGFIPAVMQLANVAAMPGIVKVSCFSVLKTNTARALLVCRIFIVDMDSLSEMLLLST